MIQESTKWFFEIKNISKSIAIALVGVYTITPISNTIYANNYPNLNGNLLHEYVVDNEKNSFDELSENDVVCYLDGVPILKKYIDENGLIEIPKDTESNFLENISIVNDYEYMDQINEESTYHNDRAVLPSGTRAEVVKKLTDTVGRFGQQTNDYYLTVSQGKELASKFDIKPWASARNFGISYLVGKFCSGSVGTAIGLADLMSTLQSAEIGKKIRSYTDKNQRVRYRVIKTNYGTFYAVNYWDGKTIDLSVVSGKEKVVHKHYK
ncbi:MAG: hypothetical protein ACRCXT_14585 [Paraclostridium sp.]